MTSTGPTRHQKAIAKTDPSTHLLTPKEPLVLVGSTGFLGKVSRRLLSNSDTPYVCLDRSTKWTRDPSWATFMEALPIHEAHCVVLAAAGVNGIIDSDGLEFNSRGIVKLMNELNEFGIRRFSVAGSCFEYGVTGNQQAFLTTRSVERPTEDYGMSKVSGLNRMKDWARTVDVEVRYMRLFQLTGAFEPEGRLLPSAISHAVNGRDFVVRQSANVRDFTDVSIVASKLLNWEGSRNSLQVLNVCSGFPRTTREIVEEIWDISGATGNLAFESGPLTGYARLVGNPAAQFGGVPVAPFDLRSHPRWSSPN